MINTSDSNISFTCLRTRAHSPSNVFTKAPITFFKVSGFDDENCWANLQQMVFIAYVNVNDATPADIQVLKALSSLYL